MAKKRKTISEDGELLADEPTILEAPVHVVPFVAVPVAPRPALALTLAEVDAAMALHEHVLVNLIRDTRGSPADGAVAKIWAGLDALRKIRETLE